MSATFSRPIWAEIDTSALRHNVRALCDLRGHGAIIGVIKADAYGHGVQIVSAVLCEEEFRANRVAMLGVASVDEGRELRERGIDAPILLLSAILPDEAAAVIASDLTPTVFTLPVARALNQAALLVNRTLKIHLKIDSGMHRLGVAHRDAARLVCELRELPNLQIGGVYTHFGQADEADEFPTQRQKTNFENALSDCEFPLDQTRPLLHAANSAAHLRFPAVRYDLSRPGLALYGLWPSLVVREAAQNEAARRNASIELKPVMSLRARITHRHELPRGAGVSYGATWRASRPSTIVVVPVGYADGYPRLASGRAHVLLRGGVAPIVGRVTMDQIMVDVTDVETQTQSKIECGEIVTLWGRDGNQTISLDDVANWSETISYEIATGLGARVTRIAV